jgi:uncharacterized membrane protein
MKEVVMPFLNLLIQQSESWHRQGLFMGMHWGWWLLWIGTAAILVWMFWRMVADRREGQRRAQEILEAEEVLRQRFARGELGEGELMDGLRALRLSHTD